MILSIVIYNDQSRGISDVNIVIRRWRKSVWLDSFLCCPEYMVRWIECISFIVIGIAIWEMYTLVHWCDAGMDVRIWCISSSVCCVGTRLTVIWVGIGVESVIFDSLDTLGAPCHRSEIASSIGWGIWRNVFICADGVGVTANWFSFHRWVKWFWGMRA